MTHARSPKRKKVLENLSKSLQQYLEGKRYTPSTASQLIEQLAIPEVHHESVQEILDDFVQEGRAKVEEGRYFPPRKSNLIVGTVSVHPKGFGFVKQEEGEDVFVPRHLLKDAVDGDTVEVEVNPVVSAKGPEGEVVAILKRSRTHLAGIVVGEEGGLYTAHAPLLGPTKTLLIRSPEHKLQEGDRVIVQVTSWGKGGAPKQTSKFKSGDSEKGTVEGTLTRLIGHISDPSIDIIAAIEEFELPDGFTKETLEEAASFGNRVTPKDLKNRLDLSDWECVTIDPDTARDFDDAISLIQDERGHFLLGVHIADVAHYVKPGSHLDKSATLRCNSTYFPGQCVPMLPEELSNELCSLKPQVKRLTQSVFIEFDTTGEMVGCAIERTCIKSKKRFTYKEAHAVLEKKKKSPHAPLLERMVSLCHLLKQKRMERGSIDFGMPEDVIMVDEKGNPLRIERVEYDITHQMIEEFMLKANEVVATHLANQGKTLIYRIHEEPTAESFQDFFTLARSLGFHLPATPKHRDIQKLFQEAKGSPLLPQLSVSFIRSMRLASYSSDNIGHYGLALEHYCHFTSPIRRYTDLIIQRLLFNEIPEGYDVDTAATACSERERISFRAESSVTLLKKLRLAQKHHLEDPTRLYKAQVTRIKPFVLFFEVPEFDLEGSIHISELGDDYFEYNPKQMLFKGARSGKFFKMGQEIEVRLDKIHLPLLQSEWSLLGGKKREKRR